MISIIKEAFGNVHIQRRTHVQHISTLTGMLLDHLVQKTETYPLTQEMRRTISMASVLHDIGKMEIGEQVLNSPEPRTPEDEETMRQHTLVGARMLEELDAYRDEDFVRVAYQICRWHHERYDGSGYPDGLVRPNNTLTRAEAAQIIFELMTDESKAQYAKKAGKTFIDVGKDHWAYKAITMMTKAGVMVGTGDGKFAPDTVITREQFATMIAQLFKIEVNQPITGYIFKDLNGNFADKYISLLYAMGILEGKGDNTFGPKDELTRAQAITIVNKLIGRLPGDGTTSFGAVADQMKTWPDNMDTSAWYYAAVQEATNSHDYTLDVNFNTLKDLKGDFFQNIKHPVTERWTVIK